MTPKEYEGSNVRYCTLHYRVLGELEITVNEYVLLDMVWKLSLKTGYCYMKRTEMALQLGFTRQGINKLIKKLEARELMVRHEKGLTVTEIFIDKCMFEGGNKVSTNQKSSKKVETKVPQKRKQSFQQVETKLPKVETKFQNNRGLELHKNNNDNNNLNNMADEPPKTQKDEISVLYYQAIKSLKLPVRNHTNLKAKIDELRGELTHKEAVDYLNFMISHYDRLSWPYKPQVTESLHIHAKRLQIKTTFDAARKEQQKNQPVRFGAKK